MVCEAFSKGLPGRFGGPCGSGGEGPDWGRPEEGEPRRCAGRGRWPHPTAGPKAASECPGPCEAAAYHQGDVLHSLGVRLGHLPGAQLGGDVSEPSPTLRFLGADAHKRTVLATVQSQDREALWVL